MRVFTPEECALWSERIVALNDRRKPTSDLGKPHRLHCEFPTGREGSALGPVHAEMFSWPSSRPG
jgi:hypothetical protein